MSSLTRAEKPAAQARRLERGQPIGAPSVELAEDQRVERGMTDDAGLGDDRADIRHSAGHVIAADVTRHDVHGLDAVLQRDDDGVARR